MNKKTVAVVFGGESSEYEISLMSAAFVIDSIPKDKYDVRTIGITRDGKWLLYSGSTDNIKNGSWVMNPANVTAFIAPDKAVGGLVAFYSDRTDVIKLDTIFPVLHGKNGEDGTVQGLFKLSGIPFVGCNHLASAVCMDKAVTHSLLTAANILQAHYLWFYSDRFAADPQRIKNKITARFSFPIFIKPANAGSSVGVSKVTSEQELDNAILKAAAQDTKVIVEEGIVGREIECAVMGGRDAIASPVGEIGASAEFYDYDDKYKNGTAQCFIPARIKPEVAEQVREIAVRAYRYLGCSGLSRVDFFVTEDDKIILNEINTIPGFTSISMYPKLWLSTGMSPQELMERLIQTAFTGNIG